MRPLAHTLRSDSEAFVCRSTHPAHFCVLREHRREKQGAGASAFLVTFAVIGKSDWPRAAIERAGGMHAWFLKQQPSP